MGASMPNSGEGRQPFNEPGWVRPVKIASVVMGILIVFCLVLLGYGLSVRVGAFSQGTSGGASQGTSGGAVESQVFEYPQGMALEASVSDGAGRMVLQFKDASGGYRVVVLDLEAGQIVSTLTLRAAGDFGFRQE